MHEKDDWFYSVLDCGRYVTYAFSCPSLLDWAYYDCVVVTYRIQFLFLRLTCVKTGEDLMEKREASKIGQDFEKTLVVGSKEELDELKAWLFKENIRLQMEKSEMMRMEEKFIKERQQFQTEMDEVNRRLVIERKRLKQDELFFEKKMDILKNGFAQLDAERRKFDKEKTEFEAKKDLHESYQRREKNQDMAEMLFQGVKSQLALKKRYKDLIKMFHPDNIAGDHEMVLTVNAVYEKLKREYEYGKQA